jgi:hypothetical protein
MVSEEGLLGVASKDDRRAFALFAPALARAARTKGNLYKNISTQWGVHWMTGERFHEINKFRESRIKRFGRFLSVKVRRLIRPANCLYL